MLRSLAFFISLLAKILWVCMFAQSYWELNHTSIVVVSFMSTIDSLRYRSVLSLSFAFLLRKH